MARIQGRMMSPLEGGRDFYWGEHLLRVGTIFIGGSIYLPGAEMTKGTMTRARERPAFCPAARGGNGYR